MQISIVKMFLVIIALMGFFSANAFAKEEGPDTSGDLFLSGGKPGGGGGGSRPSGGGGGGGGGWSSAPRSAPAPAPRPAPAPAPRAAAAPSTGSYQRQQQPQTRPQQPQSQPRQQARPQPQQQIQSQSRAKQQEQPQSQSRAQQQPAKPADTKSKTQSAAPQRPTTQSNKQGAQSNQPSTQSKNQPNNQPKADKNQAASKPVKATNLNDFKSQNSSSANKRVAREAKKNGGFAKAVPTKDGGQTVHYNNGSYTHLDKNGKVSQSFNAKTGEKKWKNADNSTTTKVGNTKSRTFVDAKGRPTATVRQTKMANGQTRKEYRNHVTGTSYTKYSGGGYRASRSYMRDGHSYRQSVSYYNGRAYYHNYYGYGWGGGYLYGYSPYYHYNSFWYGYMLGSSMYGYYPTPFTYWGWGYYSTPWFWANSYYYTPYYGNYCGVLCYMTDYVVLSTIASHYSDDDDDVQQQQQQVTEASPQEQANAQVQSVAAAAQNKNGIDDATKELIKAQIKEEIAAQAQGKSVPVDQVLADPNHVFLVNDAVEATFTDSADNSDGCSLSHGDLLQLYSKEDDGTTVDLPKPGDVQVKVQVKFAKQDDCDRGSKVVVSTEALADFHAAFSKHVENGQGDYLKKQGKNGIPAVDAKAAVAPTETMSAEDKATADAAVADVAKEAGQVEQSAAPEDQEPTPPAEEDSTGAASN